ncbi:hypothetical protein FB45DRAFT_982381 [Roridomyces roridus]|uniref:Fe2OG dioxygenase domain-containing protein n=1 Tax=Roridomyces roridus TaxID=1738132 RepID=A0AAD7B4A8_9AGAR|nr:hypothetical protein FB45DRAFT_982381 [Roridomyces roridus]
MPSINFPEFPDYPLVVEGNEAEIDKLWGAATKLGFRYLKSRGPDDLLEGMFQMARETMLRREATGANAVDATGQPDTVELVNVAKDDALAWPKKARHAYPSTVNPWNSNIPSFRYSTKRHLVDEYSGSETHVIKNPPSPQEPPKVAIGAHTDFGSLSFLHNRLGGLQVLVPDSEDWQYIKPLPGHAICNIGDALALFSGGILRSNLHRVVPPPGWQAQFDRWSLVYLTRPGNSWFTRRVKNFRMKNRTVSPFIYGGITCKLRHDRARKPG